MDNNIFKFNNNENYNNKDKNKIVNISTIGFNLQFDLILSLTKEQLTNYNINFNEMNNLEYLKDKFNENLLSFINISSNDFLFNTILFINRTNKIKSNIKYIIPFTPCAQVSFMDNIIKNILQKEGISIIPLNLIDKKAEINFIFNIIKNNKIMSSKKFYVENKIKNDNDINNDDLLKIKVISNSLKKCDYVLTSINNINNYSIIFKDNKSFEKLIDNLKIWKLCVIYDNSIINDFTKRIMSITDIYFLEKKEIDNYFKLDNKNKDKDIDKQIINFTKKKEQKENKKLKLILLIDTLKTINIIQYDSVTQLILLKFTEPIILNELNNKEEEFINDNYNYLKSVYIGAFIVGYFIIKHSIHV